MIFIRWAVCVHIYRMCCFLLVFNRPKGVLISNNNNNNNLFLWWRSGETCEKKNTIHIVYFAAISTKNFFRLKYHSFLLNGKTLRTTNVLTFRKVAFFLSLSKCIESASSLLWEGKDGSSVSATESTFFIVCHLFLFYFRISIFGHMYMRWFAWTNAYKTWRDDTCLHSIHAIV